LYRPGCWVPDPFKVVPRKEEKQSKKGKLCEMRCFRSLLVSSVSIPNALLTIIKEKRNRKRKTVAPKRTNSQRKNLPGVNVNPHQKARPFVSLKPPAISSWKRDSKFS